MVTGYLQAVLDDWTVDFEIRVYSVTGHVFTRFQIYSNLARAFCKLVDNFVSEPKLTRKISKAVFIFDPGSIE